MIQSKFEFKILPGININTEKFSLIFMNFLSHNNFLKNKQFLTTQQRFVNQLSAASFEKYFVQSLCALYYRPFLLKVA